MAVTLLVLVVAMPLYFLRGIGVFDDSVFLKYGQLMRHGLLPYRDYFDNKLPATHFVSWALASIGDDDWLTPRIFMFLLSLGSCFLLFQYGRRYFSDQTATWFSCALLACSLPLTQGYSLHTEGPLLFFAIIGSAFLARPSDGRLLRVFLGGLFLGIATIFKQPGALLAIGAGLALLFRYRQRLNSAVVPMFLYGIGFITPLLLLLLWIAGHGILNQFFEAVTNRGLVALDRYNFQVQNIVVLCARTPAIAITGVSLALYALSPSLRQRVAEFYASTLDVWLLSGLFYLLIFLKVSSSNGHYAAPASAAFSIVNGQILAWALADETLLRYRRILALGVVSMLIGYIIVIGWGSYQMIATRALKVDIEVQTRLQNWLDTHSSANVPIQVYSRRSIPRLYLMSHRPPFSSYIYTGIEIRDVNRPQDILASILSGKPPLFALEFPRDGCLEESGIKLCPKDLVALSQWYEWIELRTEPPRWDRVVVGARRAPIVESASMFLKGTD